MVNLPLPDRSTLQPELILRVDRIREACGLTNDAVDAACEFSRGTVARLRAGHGAHYDTIQTLTSWVAAREAEISVADSTATEAVPASNQSSH